MCKKPVRKSLLWEKFISTSSQSVVCLYQLPDWSKGYPKPSRLMWWRHAGTWRVVTILSIHFQLSSPGSVMQMPVVTIHKNQDERPSSCPWLKGRGHSLTDWLTDWLVALCWCTVLNRSCFTLCFSRSQKPCGKEDVKQAGSYAFPHPMILVSTPARVACVSLP